MELFASRGYFFCRYCGSFHFPDTKADDGIRIVGETPEAAGLCRLQQAAHLGDARRDASHSILPELPRRADRPNRLRGRRAEAALLGDRYSARRRFPSIATSSSAKCVARCARDPCRRIPTTGPATSSSTAARRASSSGSTSASFEQIVDAPGKDRGTREMPRPVKGEPVGNSITGFRVVGTGARTADPPDEPDLLTILTRLF